MMAADPSTSSRVDTAPANGGRFGKLVGSSRPMQQVYDLLATVAPTKATVLIEGETGTGKELVAEEIHRGSHRRLFSVVDCAALPRGLIESELFGHERGAFTNATTNRVGVFEQTRGGTVFLDEIGELPLEMQMRLLRVLDRRTIKRVGSDVTRKVDFRLVAATNRDLLREVSAGRFRQDLYYRLAVVQIKVPPLRERREDIPALARLFLFQAGCADADAVLSENRLQALCSRRWPGNVRELRNVVEQAVILSDNGLLEELPPGSSLDGIEETDRLDFPSTYMKMRYKAAKDLLVRQFEARYFGQMLKRNGQNLSSIARDAGIARRHVRSLLHKHQLID